MTAHFLRKSDFLKRRSKNSVPSRLGIWRGRIIPAIGAVIVFIVSFSVLYMGDNVGVSDNGDFRRVLLTNNIEYADDTDYYYLFKQHYIMKLENDSNIFTAMHSAWQTNKDEEIYSSPHFLIIKISKELNVLANAVSGRPLTSYNIAYLALLYTFMLTIAAWVIFTFFADAKVKTQIAVFLLFIFIFCDAGYVLYFNSFYGEPLQYTALLMLVSFGMLIYKRPSVPKVIGFFVSLYFFAGSKLANIPYSLMVAVLAVFMGIMRRDALFKLGVIISAAVCIINIVGLYNSIPDWMNQDTTYQAVFFGITKNSSDPAKDLEELGVDDEYAVLAGTHAYMDEDEYPIDIKTEKFKADFYDEVSKFDIAKFYLRHPVRFIKAMGCAIENSAYIRPPSLGNMTDVPMHHTDKFSYWSNMRIVFRFLYEPWVIFTAFVLITGYMLFMNMFYIHNHRIETPEKRYMICSLDILILGLWINLALPVLANGEADIAKHMFLFTNCIDILFFVMVMGIITSPFKKLALSSLSLALFTGIFNLQIPTSAVTFGTLDGEPIDWVVSDSYDDGTMLIVTKECIRDMPFDDDSNSWSDSDLRHWLNTEFLAEFSDAELERIQPTQNKLILTYGEREAAVGGNHSHYWNFTRALVNDMGESAYYSYIQDRVFVPTLEMMKYIDVYDSYWIMCPYTSNDYMVRFMDKDGFILHTNVKNNKGVRAVMRIKAE